MATDIPLRPADTASLDDGDGTSARRPVAPAHGPAVRLRKLIGVDEGLLTWVPEMRTRYTLYGALVFNTAVVGAASMALALGSFRSDLPWPAVACVSLIWFWVVLTLDSWLVSSTHGTQVKKWTLMLRFFLSVLLGLFIAEPILFQIFDKEIRQEIAVGNEQKVADYRGMLVSCNPTDGTSTTGRPECGRYQLKVAGSPAELDRQIENNTARAATLRTQVDGLGKKHDDKLATEQRLCGPKYYIWTGRGRDVTITCKRARTATSDAATELEPYEKQLKDLTAKVQTLTAQKERAANDYQPLLQRAIDDKTSRRAAALDTDGILTRAHGLTKVAGADGFALFLTVVLHLLLLGFDAMPVLAKLMSGATVYDELLGKRFETSRRLYSEELQVQQACARLEHEVQRHQVEQDTADRMRRLELEYHRAQAERAAEERSELEARMRRILAARRA
ncbi:DUF4407 domain-containing protein [Streptomyces aurantiogriseus]|uniref:DUF4407 domain-containing protein n=1 Tax=Streptomyces aurantiogriseus TaxID=66870 RepID=A0A918C5Q1_9ACTN|nr:DUF4407 domain-containing protein [Streptomyces aurantiogriseus]GGR06996.1 hypothetical protein GCM10010251_23520 [Streptomyces aurantiogriseus]